MVIIPKNERLITFLIYRQKKDNYEIILHPYSGSQPPVYNVRYITIRHSSAFTSQEVAAKAHISGKELATEYEFKNRFPDCELGAMPPFGNLYDMEVYVAESLSLDKEIAFNAGSHTELIRLSYADYARLVKPRIFKFTWKTVSFPGDPSERWQDDL
jgi:Ala-tRNA(Pro) deacylase